MLDRLLGLEELSEELTGELVEVMFSGLMPTVAHLVVNLAICIIAVSVADAKVMLLVAAWMLGTSLWRLNDFVTYARAPELRTARQWARRGVIGSALVGSAWAAEALTIPILPDPYLAAVVLGTLSALLISGGVRNCAVRAAAHAQIVIAAAAMIAGCSLSHEVYLRLYAIFVLLQGIAAYGIANTLHRELVRNRQNERESRDLASELARANASLALLNNHLQEEVAIDPLTGLLNRRAFDLAAAREWRIVARERLPCTVLMIDVDHFKRFNDRYGHQAGDECLRAIAEIMRAIFKRPADILARFGGEEFVAILSGTSESVATGIAERLLNAIAERGIEHAASPVGQVSLSIGVAGTKRARETTLQALIGTADVALYAAKNSGRGRVRQAEHAIPPSLAPELA